MTQPTESGWRQRFDTLYQQSHDQRLRRYFSSGRVSGNAAISNVPLLAMDFETTGLNADCDEIVSIGLVPFSMSRIHCRQSAYWLLQPAAKLAEESIVIHGITHSKIAKAPDLDQVLAALLEQMAGRLVVVHYHPIERNFLAQALLKRIQESIEFPVIDTLLLEQRILKQQQTTWQRMLRQRLPSLRLGACRARYNLPFYQAHHALTDALATAELLQAQIAHAFEPSTPVSKLWC